MAASFRDGAVVGLCLMAMVVVVSIGAEAHLTVDFYDKSCPQIYDIVKSEVRKAVKAEARMAASLVRLHFHDCFVHGCDGSILLNQSDTIDSEKTSRANNNSIRGFPVIDAIKAKLEAACPQTVSCADIVALASRDAAVEAGLTQKYYVFFGRRDSLTAFRALADKFLPAPFFSLSQLKQNFSAVGLDEVDLVALSGAHTIGRISCATENIPLMQNNTEFGFNPSFHHSNQVACSGNDNGTKLLDLDHTTPDFFDNSYYKNLLKGQGILGSDQELWSTPGVINQGLVKAYVVNPWAFATQFALSTIKMGFISPLTGDEGEIRLNCALVNDATSSSGSAASLVASE